MCVHNKHEVKKNDTTAMTAATNEACMEWLDENYYLMGQEWQLIVKNANLLKTFFLVGKMSKFLTVDWYSHPFPGFPMKV